MATSPNNPRTHWTRAVLHADMDAFYASVEQRDQPELRGKPVIVGGTGRRGVVAAASYEARKFGVYSAMPSAVARRKCPDGIFVHPRMSEYAEASRQVHAVFAELTPLIEPLSLDEAFLDVTGSQGLFGDPAAIAQRIKDEVRSATQLTISVGAASCKFVAKVASDLEKPDGLTVVTPGTERDFLAPLPIRRLWGAGKVTQKRFAKLGLHTIADLQSKELDELTDMLGQRMGSHYHDLSRAIDPRPVVAERDPKSISHEVTFSTDRNTREECHSILMELAEKVGRRLRKHELSGTVVRLKLRDPDFTTVTRQKKLRTATDDDVAIFRTVRDLFDIARPQMQPVRLLGVAVAEFAGRGDLDKPTLQQLELFGPKSDNQPQEKPIADKSHSVLEAMDSIRDRFGENAIQHGRTQENTHHNDDVYGPQKS